jgi:IstB-like ATP binding protein
MRTKKKAKRTSWVWNKRVKKIADEGQRLMRSPTIVTSNLPFDEWTSVFGSERLTGALLDRLTHHVHILQMNGDSYRLNQSI